MTRNQRYRAELLEAETEIPVSTGGGGKSIADAAETGL